MPLGSIDLPQSGASCASFVDALRARALETPDRRAFVFLEGGEEPGIPLTFGELDALARAIGAVLQRTAKLGERALLVYPPGLDFIAAFMGCLYAGVLAVPAYPPVPSRLARTLPRFQTVATDARATIVLTTAAFAELAPALTPMAPKLAALTWIATDTIAKGEAAAWKDPELRPESMAFLQYTSGSTDVPKGVMVSHANLLHNTLAHYHVARHTPESVHVSWLPCYHDMGLINGILQPIFSAPLGVLMPPLAFLKDPVRWLRAITRYRGTSTSFPNFALDLCVRKVPREALASLDLSSLTLAVNGAEPVRAETMDRFVAMFGACGFRRSALYPAYGLAEGTILVSGGLLSAEPVVLDVDKEELARHRVVRANEAGPRTRTLVASGRTIEGQRIRIVDPVTLRACAPDAIGEIWVTGPSVAMGYWEQPEETEKTFRAQIAGEEGDGHARYLRTGDLGFLHEQELFLTGRLKDVLLVRGRNVYPQDLEQAAEESHAGLRPGGSAAFSAEHLGEEVAVLCAEVEASVTSGTVDEVARAIRREVAERCGVSLRAVVLLKTGTLPKTSSGKVQRSACREAYAGKRLESIGESVLADDAPVAAEHAPPPALGTLAAATRALAEQKRALVDYVRGQVALAFELPLEQVKLDVPLGDFGADSLQLMNLSAALEKGLGVALPGELLAGDPTVAQLVESLLKAVTEAV